MQNLSLYIDHQAIAPLVRLLENTVETARKEQGLQNEIHELRTNIYAGFVSTLHDIFASKNPGIKVEDEAFRVQGGYETQNYFQSIPHIEGLMPIFTAQGRPRRTRGPTPKSLEVQLQLAQWIISSDKRIFEKKEIDEKYQTLMDNNKRTITLEKIGEIASKYKISALIVRKRNGEEHYFGSELDSSTHSTIVKKEENSLSKSLFMGDDEDTMKMAFNQTLEEVKQECDQLCEQDQNTSPFPYIFNPNQSSKPALMQQQQSNDYLPNQ